MPIVYSFNSCCLSFKETFDYELQKTSQPFAERKYRARRMLCSSARTASGVATTSGITVVDYDYGLTTIRSKLPRLVTRPSYRN